MPEMHISAHARYMHGSFSHKQHRGTALAPFQRLKSEGSDVVLPEWTPERRKKTAANGAAPCFGIRRKNLGVHSFFTIFLSTSQVPISAMTGWLRSVARINPITNIFRLSRSGWVNASDPGHMSWSNAYGGLIAIAVLSVLSLIFALRSLQKIDK